MSPFRLIGLACVLGVVAGVALSFKRQNDDERELRRLSEQLKGLPAERFPSAPAAGPQPRALASSLIDPETVEGIPAYPHSVARDLAGSLKTQGLEMKVGWFETLDAPEDVLNFYEKKFVEAGRLPVSHRYSANAGYVGFLDSKDEKLHLVTVMKNYRKTLVFPSASYPGKFLSGAAEVPQSVPVLPGANGSLMFDFDEGKQERRSYFATVADRSLAEVADFYKKAFVEKGWVVQEVNEAKPSEIRIDARRGQGSCNVLVQMREHKVAIYVSIEGQV